jgi:hypothetical protein
MKESKHGAVHHAEVASHIPGRLRVRLPRGSHRPQVLKRIKEGLEEQAGIHGVEINQTAGSATVKYDPDVHTGSGIVGLLRDLDVVVGTVLKVPHIEGEKGEQGGVTFAEALADLNQRLTLFTGIPIDLTILLPLSLAGAGLWLIAVNGLMIETMPGWLLLWFAFDAYLKLNPYHPLPSPKPACVA